MGARVRLHGRGGQGLAAPFETAPCRRFLRDTARISLNHKLLPLALQGEGAGGEVASPSPFRERGQGVRLHPPRTLGEG